MEKCKDPFSRIKNNRMRSAILISVTKPAILSDIAAATAKILELQKPQKITVHIKKLTNSGIIKILTPKLQNNKPGKVYGLTNKGRRVKKKLSLMNEIPCTYNEPANIDWHAYGWCLTGTQKKAIISILEKKPLRPIEIKHKIREKYKNRNNARGITFQNLNDILQLMVKRKIVSVKEEQVKKKKKPIKKYKLTKKGMEIQSLILLPRIN